MFAEYSTWHDDIDNLNQDDTVSYYTNMSLYLSNFDTYSSWYDVESDSTDALSGDINNILLVSNKLQNDINEVYHMVCTAYCDYAVFRDYYSFYKRNLMYKYFQKLKRKYLKNKQKQKEHYRKLMDELIYIEDYLT